MPIVNINVGSAPSVEGIPQLDGNVHMLINAVADGGWGTGDKAWTPGALMAAFGERTEGKS